RFSRQAGGRGAAHQRGELRRGPSPVHGPQRAVLATQPARALRGEAGVAIRSDRAPSSGSGGTGSPSAAPPAGSAPPCAHGTTRLAGTTAPGTEAGNRRSRRTPSGSARLVGSSG